MPTESKKDESDQSVSGRLQQIVMPDDDQMCCVKCAYIAEKDEGFAVETIEGEEYPICPNCGDHDIGGYGCYETADLWMEEDLIEIVIRNQEKA